MKGETAVVIFSVLVLSTLLVIQTEAKKSNMANVKRKWPELEGKMGEEAKTVILQERPGLEVHVVPEDAMMTMDFREDRVRIMVNAEGKVVKPPSIG